MHPEVEPVLQIIAKESFGAPQKFLQCRGGDEDKKNIDNLNFL